MFVDFLWELFGSNALGVTDVLFTIFDALAAGMSGWPLAFFNTIVESLFT